MPTIGLKVQGDGHFQGWSSIVGAIFAWEAVDDSDGVTHDGAATYIRFPNNDPVAGNRISFPLFLQAEGLLPISIILTIVAQRVGIAHPQIQLGFTRGGLVGFAGPMLNPGATWRLGSNTYSTNPITGGAWSASDLIGLEACFQNEPGVFGSNDVTLISGSIIYDESHNHEVDPNPIGQALA